MFGPILLVWLDFGPITPQKIGPHDPTKVQPHKIDPTKKFFRVDLPPQKSRPEIRRKVAHRAITETYRRQKEGHDY